MISNFKNIFLRTRLEQITLVDGDQWFHGYHHSNQSSGQSETQERIIKPPHARTAMRNYLTPPGTCKSNRQRGPQKTQYRVLVKSIKARRGGMHRGGLEAKSWKTDGQAKGY